MAKEAVDELKAYLESGECLVLHLSDRIIAFLGLAKGNSSFTTSKISEHLVTSLWLVRQFLNVEVATGEKEARGEGSIFGIPKEIDPLGGGKHPLEGREESAIQGQP